MAGRIGLLGANGFIGGALVRAFPPDALVPFSRTAHEHERRLDLLALGAADASKLAPLSVLINCVGEVRVPARMWTTNRDALGPLFRLLLDNANRTGQACRLVHLSSVGVYGRAAYRGTEACLGEDAPMRPDNLYERSKAEGDALLLAEAERYRYPVTLLRPSTVIGPEMRSTLLRRLQAWCAARIPMPLFGERVRANVIPVHRLADVVRSLLLAETGIPSVLNLSHDLDMPAFLRALAAPLGTGGTTVRMPAWFRPVAATVADRVPMARGPVDFLSGQIRYPSGHLAPSAIHDEGTILADVRRISEALADRHVAS